MNTATRLGLYGAGLAVVFGVAFTTADAVVPQSTVDSWTEDAGDHGATSGHETSSSGGDPAQPVVRGVTSAQDGYLLSPLVVPDRTGKRSDLSFRILDPDGDAVTRFVEQHERKLHLIVVRADGTRFRHVHPTMAADGTWSLPWEWAAAGTYRVYADFVPEGAEPMTLTRAVEVAGRFAPVQTAPTRTASVHGFTVELAGELIAGTSSELTLTVSRAGKPIGTLQPYLGAFGHLVALRAGDLAYLHVHPDGEEPSAGETSGPDIEFAAEVPTPGRYLLYLDFRVGGRVHTASFVVDTSATPGSTGAAQSPGSEQGDHSSDPEPGGGHGH